jgi:hypothetical protein
MKAPSWLRAFFAEVVAEPTADLTTQDVSALGQSWSVHDRNVLTLTLAPNAPSQKPYAM